MLASRFGEYSRSKPTFAKAATTTDLQYVVKPSLSLFLFLLVVYCLLSIVAVQDQGERSAVLLGDEIPRSVTVATPASPDFQRFL